jgi:hypothetical protein
MKEHFLKQQLSMSGKSHKMATQQQTGSLMGNRGGKGNYSDSVHN